MALSNIFREPRREITETVVGMALVTVPIAAIILLRWASRNFLGVGMNFHGLGAWYLCRLA